MSYSKDKKLSTNSRKNAVIYARYSSASQTEQSIEGQIRVISEYAVRENYTIIGTYIDRAMTGTNDNRPDFQQMISDSYRREFDYVIVYKLDRFSRNRYDSAINKKILRNNGVKVISATEMITDTPEGIIMESMLEGWNEYYSAELSMKVKRGLNESYNKGYYTGGFILYGYRVENKQIVIEESGASSVQKIFKDYANGILIKHIVNDLNAQGIKTNLGKEWTINKISRILNNKKYTGVVMHDEIEYSNIYPAIVDKELFHIVSKILATNKRRTSHFKTPIPYYLSGKLFCMHCNAQMNGESGTGRSKVYSYYKCQTNKHKKGTCEKTTIKKDMLEEYVLDKIQQYILQPKYISTLAKEMCLSFNSRINNNSELTVLKKALNKVEKEITNTLNAIKMGIVTTSTKEMLLNLENQKEKLLINIAKINNRKQKNLTIDECEDFLFSLTTLDLSIPENKQLLIDRFIKKVEIGNTKIRIYFNPSNNTSLYSNREIDFEDTDKNNSSGKSLPPPLELSIADT